MYLLSSVGAIKEFQNFEETLSVDIELRKCTIKLILPQSIYFLVHQTLCYITTMKNIHKCENIVVIPQKLE